MTVTQIERSLACTAYGVKPYGFVLSLERGHDRQPSKVRHVGPIRLHVQYPWQVG